MSIVKPSCTFIRPDSCAQTAVFRIPERFFRCLCYKSYNGGPRGFPPMADNSPASTKPGENKLAPRGSAQVLRIQSRTVLEPPSHDCT